MELPKNITQIGEANRNCKVYVEDYVVSYIKQINQVACNKEMAVALYGTRKTENNVTYIFLYGAAKLDFLQRETRHLSQAQQQEIEKLRRKHFADYEFQGYRLLNGEMVEGFHICEQDICRYIPGYAQFYEKNDCMLAYMLEARPVEAAPETVNQEKYDMVRKRQEERREDYRSGETSQRKLEREYGRTEETVTSPQMTSRSMKRMRVSTVAIFGLLCLAGFAMLMEDQGTEGIQVAARQAMSELTEQKLPDMEAASKMEEEVSTLIAEDKLTEAVLAENVEVAAPIVTSAPAATPEPAAPSEPAATPEPVTTPESTATQTPVTPPELTATPAPVVTPEPTATPAPVTSSEPAVASEVNTVVPTASYIIQKGDTLIDICIRQYGSDKKVKEVCNLNGIDDADDIRVGQKILLP
ncbi:MAG: LysM peptidoglycan-binding domain-containing protein [Lachnospiraceae bacterium]|nr:LysM peptidoglycan-binding domain-containing protein [Lachnospiraceae bacterium]